MDLIFKQNGWPRLSVKVQQNVPIQDFLLANHFLEVRNAMLFKRKYIIYVFSALWIVLQCPCSWVVQRTRKLMIGWMNTNQGPLWTILHLKIRGSDTGNNVHAYAGIGAYTITLSKYSALHDRISYQISWSLWSSSRSSCRETYIFSGQKQW